MTEVRKRGRKKPGRKKNVASLQHDVMLAAFRSPNTEQKQTTWTPDFLSRERFVFSAAPAACASWKKHTAR